MTKLVESGESGHYFDDELHPGMKDKLLSYKPLERPIKIVTAGRQVLQGTATGTVFGKIIDTESNKHQVNRKGLIVPGLGHDLFSTSQAAETGMNITINSRPRLEQGHHVLPRHQLNMNLELFSFAIEIAEATRNEVALSAIRVPADIWHRRMGYINSQSLRILRDAGGNGINYSDNMSPCDVCAFGKSKQQCYPKITTRATDRPSQLV